MDNNATKNKRLSIRCDRHARELLEKAATYTHVSVSEFVLLHALVSAEKVVQENECITLKPEDFRTFLAVLDKPVKANPILKKAMKRHSRQVAR